MRKNFIRPPRRFSDAELLLEELVSYDANSIPNVVNERLPEGVAIVDVFSKYLHAKYPAEKIYCCVCGARHHKVGFHIGRSDGVEATLGNCCAKAHLGPEYVRAAMRSKDERSRQYYLRAIHEFNPTALRITLENMLRPWRALAATLRALRSDLRETFPQVFETLQDAATHNAPLLMPVRQLKSEWKRDDRQEDDDAKDRYSWQFVPAFRISGAALLRGGDPLQIVKDLDRVLANFRGIAADTDRYTTGELRRFVATLRQAKRGFETLMAMRSAVDEFFASDHLAALAGWINANCEHHGMRISERASANGHTLTNEWSERSVTKPGLPVIADDLLAALRAA